MALIRSKIMDVAKANCKYFLKNNTYTKVTKNTLEKRLPVYISNINKSDISIFISIGIWDSTFAPKFSLKNMIRNKMLKL